MGRKILTHNGPVSTPTVDLITARIYWNSVLYTPDAKYQIVDVENFYVKNPTNKKEYYKISINLVTQEIIENYDPTKNKIDGHVYFRV